MGVNVPARPVRADDRSVRKVSVRRGQPVRPEPVPPALRILPYTLMVVSLVATVGTLDWGIGASLPQIFALAAAVLGYRWWGERRPGVRIAWFVTHSVLTLVLVAVAPFCCIYAFTGYIDAQHRLPRRLMMPAMVATAGVVALGQTGGVRSLTQRPWLYLVLFIVNAALGTLMTRLGLQREREVERREAAVRALEAEQRRNAALQAQLLEQAREAGVLDERARLSREIHDTVAQGLIGIITQLGSIDPDDDAAAWQARVRTADTVARESLAEARRAIHALGSPRLDRDDLPAALRSAVVRWSEASGVEAIVHVDGVARPTAHDETLLRVAQEAMANAARHADATRVAVTVTYGDREVRLDVRDDGRGFDPARVPAGTGLAGIRARVAAADGTLEIETGEGEGCAVSAAVPT